MAEILPPFPAKPTGAVAGEGSREVVKDAMQAYLTALLGLRLVRDGSNAAMVIAGFFQVMSQSCDYSCCFDVLI
jgi:hypothetical protein